MRHPEHPQQHILTWSDIDSLIDKLIPQMQGVFDSLLMVTRGGIIPGGMIAEALDIKQILVAAVEFPSENVPSLLAWPSFLQFPTEDLARGRRILVVDDVWTHGRHIMTVRGRLEAFGARPETAVLHYKPSQSLFPNQKPTYHAAITGQYIVYPWEMDRRARGVRMFEPVM
jgi:hypothetical protein